MCPHLCLNSNVMHEANINYQGVSCSGQSSEEPLLESPTESDKRLEVAEITQIALFINQEELPAEVRIIGVL